MDLDADGVEETYRFGVLVEGLQFAPIEIDNVGCSDMDLNYRCVAPGLWRCNADGSLTLAEDLAARLEMPETRIYCVEQTGPELPEVWAAEAIGGVWNGAVAMEQRAQCAGEWLVEVQATVAGQPLTGYMVSNISVLQETG